MTRVNQGDLVMLAATETSKWKYTDMVLTVDSLGDPCGAARNRRRDARLNGARPGLAPRAAILKPARN